ncbi:MAG: hypothetical protein JST16_14640 [Bdellovibrionales bacterium]|nr:hypothetical protein [Bdellovibrionales bacterium]
MKKLALELALFVGISSPAFASGSAHEAHNHDPKKGGAVMMFGDEHIEIKTDPANPKTVLLYISDKFRKPVALNLVTLKADLVEPQPKGKDLVKSLPIEKDAKTSNLARVKIPEEAAAGAQLQLSVFRNHPPKGYMVDKDPQPIDVDVLNKLGQGQ